MKTRRSQAFQPRSEAVEDRLTLSFVPSMRAVVAERVADLRARQVENRPLVANNAALRPMPNHVAGITVPGRFGPRSPVAGPGFLGNQGGPFHGRPSAPNASVDYGLITIRNATRAPVVFSVSASTYQDGAFFNFRLPPGGGQVYYAPYGGPFHSAPSFLVSFDTVEHRSAVQLSDVATTRAPAGWAPVDVSLGRPYAIVAQAGRLNVVPVAAGRWG